MADNSFKIEKSLSLKPLASPPNNPINGDMYYDSTIPALRTYFNGVWVNIDDAGITLVGAIDSEPKTADGGVIDHGLMFLQTADATYPGAVSVGTQDFAGAKTFIDSVTFQSPVTFAGQLLDDGTQLAPSLAFTNSLSTGLYSPAVDQLAISADDTTVLTALSTGITVSGVLNTDSLVSVGTISGTAITGTSLSTGSGAIGGGAITGSSINGGTISGTSITGTSLSVGSGAISGGAITGTSLNLGTGGDITCDNITCDAIDTTGNSITTNNGAIIAGTGTISGGTITATSVISGAGLSITGGGGFGSTVGALRYVADGGSAGTTAYGFDGDEGGLYFATHPKIASNDGTEAMLFGNSTVITNRAISTSGSSADGIKWKVFTNTFSGGPQSLDLDIAGATVLGAVGFWTETNANDWEVMDTSTPAGEHVHFSKNTSGAQVRVASTGIQNKTYRVVVYYI